MTASDSSRALSSFVANHPHARELTTLNETGLITVEQGRALAQATTSWNVLKSVTGATKDGAPAPRHFNKVDRLLAVRIPTAAGQARTLLSQIGSQWDALSGEFHRFREMYMEAKLKRAELNKKARIITEQIGKGELEPDDVAIQEAMIQLQGAQIDRLEAEVTRGQSQLKAEIATMTDRSVRYQALLTTAGKTEFTAADFEAEEIDYLLKSAWMVAAQSYGAMPIRNADGTPSHLKRIITPHEIELYFGNLGVTVQQLAKEFQDLQLQRESFDMTQRGVDAFGSQRQQNAEGVVRHRFADQFDNWIVRMVAKYRGQIVAAVKQHGIERLKGIQEIIDPPNDRGKQGPEAPERRSVLS
jgi:hypothetical protein